MCDECNGTCGDAVRAKAMARSKELHAQNHLVKLPVRAKLLPKPKLAPGQSLVYKDEAGRIQAIESNDGSVKTFTYAGDRINGIYEGKPKADGTIDAPGWPCDGICEVSPTGDPIVDQYVQRGLATAGLAPMPRKDAAGSIHARAIARSLGGPNGGAMTPHLLDDDDPKYNRSRPKATDWRAEAVKGCEAITSRWSSRAKADRVNRLYRKAVAKAESLEAANRLVKRMVADEEKAVEARRLKSAQVKLAQAELGDDE